MGMKKWREINAVGCSLIWHRSSLHWREYGLQLALSLRPAWDTKGGFSSGGPEGTADSQPLRSERHGDRQPIITHLDTKRKSQLDLYYQLSCFVHFMVKRPNRHQAAWPPSTRVAAVSLCQTIPNIGALWWRVTRACLYKRNLSPPPPRCITFNSVSLWGNTVLMATSENLLQMEPVTLGGLTSQHISDNWTAQLNFSEQFPLVILRKYLCPRFPSQGHAFSKKLRVQCRETAIYYESRKLSRPNLKSTAQRYKRSLHHRNAIIAQQRQQFNSSW